MIGAFSAFPEPNPLIKSLQQNELVQWLMVFILIMQGGASGNVQLALVTTLIGFVVNKLLSMQPVMPVVVAPPAPEEAEAEKFFMYRH